MNGEEALKFLGFLKKPITEQELSEFKALFDKEVQSKMESYAKERAVEFASVAPLLCAKADMNTSLSDVYDTFIKEQ